MILRFCRPQWLSRDSNPGQIGRDSDALTTEPQRWHYWSSYSLTVILLHFANTIFTAIYYNVWRWVTCPFSQTICLEQVFSFISGKSIPSGIQPWIFEWYLHWLFGKGFMWERHIHGLVPIITSLQQPLRIWINKKYAFTTLSPSIGEVPQCCVMLD